MQQAAPSVRGQYFESCRRRVKQLLYFMRLLMLNRREETDVLGKKFEDNESCWDWQVGEERRLYNAMYL